MHDGRRITAPSTFATVADANAWLDNESSARARGTWIDPTRGKLTFREYSVRFMAEWPGLADTTREQYQSLLDLHILPTFGDMALSAIIPSDVRSWFTPLSKRHPSTAAKAYRRLAHMMKIAAQDELILKSPVHIVGAAEEPVSERPTLTMEEFDALLEVAPERLRALLVMAAWCAFRRGEIRGLRRKNIDLVAGFVTVDQTRPVTMSGKEVVKGPKSKAGGRRIAIPPEAIPQIELHLEKFVGPFPESIVFTGDDGERYPVRTLYKRYDKARRAIGRPEVTLHDLRHSGLTWAGQAGATGAELMYRGGQSDLKTVSRYQHTTQQRDSDLASRMSRRDRAEHPENGHPKAAGA